MFILDLYKFCESYDKFNRQHIAKFIFTHKDCERFARSAGVTPRMFATMASKEFCARMMGLRYLDGLSCVYWHRGAQNRPFNFNFHCFGGLDDRYTWEMNNIEKMSDAELFK